MEIAKRNLEYEKEIFDIVKNNPQRYGRMLRAKGSKNHSNPNREHLLRYIFERTAFLDDIENAVLPLRLLYLRNDVQEKPICCIEGCGKPVKKFTLVHFPGIFGDIREFLSKQPCCKECSGKLGARERVKYFQEHYGPNVVNTFQLKETKDKIADTKIRLHGDPNYSNLEKSKATIRLKHGVDYYFQTNEFQEKSAQTKIEHFGYDHQMRCPEIKAGMAERYRAAHGVDYSTQNPAVIAKARRKYSYDGRWFDSGWEVAYYKWLKDSDKQFVFHPMDVDFRYVSNGKEHKYYPDFFVDGQYIELKSDKTYQKYSEDLNKQWPSIGQQTMQDKFKLILRLEKEGKLKILQFKDMLPIFDYIRQTCGKCYNAWKNQYKVYDVKTNA